MKRYLPFLFITIIVLATVISFKKDNTTNVENNVDYNATIKEYPQRGVLPENTLDIDIEQSSINFRIDFQGGSGENEKVSLTKNGNKYIINLINTDNRSNEMFAVFDLAGEIMNIPSGDYSLIVIDSTGRVVDTKTFSIN